MMGTKHEHHWTRAGNSVTCACGEKEEAVAFAQRNPILGAALEIILPAVSPPGRRWR